MAFFAYVDCSGDANDPNIRVITVAGYIAHEGQWAIFEERWTSVLQSFGVDALHMKEYAHSAKGSQFENWRSDTKKRNDFMAALTAVINSCEFQSVSVTIPLSEYDKANDDSLIREGFGPPYAVAALKAVADTTTWHKRHGHDEPLMILLEKGDNEQASFTRLLERLGEWNIDLVTPPIIQPKKWKTASGKTQYCVPFQAADFLCYEHAKMFTDFIKTGKTTVRESIFSVSYPPRGDEDMNQVLHAGWMRGIADRFNVARRFNRPSDGETEMPSEALTFLDMDQPLVATVNPASCSKKASRAVVEAVGPVRTRG